METCIHGRLLFLKTTHLLHPLVSVFIAVEPFLALSTSKKGIICIPKKVFTKTGHSLSHNLCLEEHLQHNTISNYLPFHSEWKLK